MVIFNMYVGWSISIPFRLSIYVFNIDLVDINGNAQLGFLASANHVRSESETYSKIRFLE